MLEVQNWLREQNFDYAKLEEQLGIKATFHEVDDRVILNYNQISSPKGNNLVQECRALTLNKTNAELIARGFSRFFNWGERQHEERWFKWEDSISYEKVDGSLVLTYQYNDDIHLNTRGSFGNGEVVQGMMTWRELFNLAVPDWKDKVKAAGLQSFTLVWELCSLYNQVVRIYNEPTAYLLSAYSTEYEVKDEAVDDMAKVLGVKRPQKWRHNDAFDVFAHINAIAETDMTFEGCVIRDVHDHRWKIKSESYLKLHRLSNNGNIAHTKNLVPLILKGESAEVISYFPALKEQIEKLEVKINKLRTEVDNIWYCHHDQASQKKFALAVKDHPCSAVLFKARSSGRDVKDVFNESADLLIKVLI